MNDSGITYYEQIEGEYDVASQLYKKLCFIGAPQSEIDAADLEATRLWDILTEGNDT